MEAPSILTIETEKPKDNLNFDVTDSFQLDD